MNKNKKFEKKNYKKPEFKEIGSVLKLTQQVRLSSKGDNAGQNNKKAIS